jgi:hypothetical protein
LRRQAKTSRATPAGSSFLEGLDPFGLPLCFQDTDLAADHLVRTVELHRDRVILRRVVSGIKMAVNLAISAYLGVVVRIEPGGKASPPQVAVFLEHSDRALSITLWRAPDGSDMIAQWRCWGTALGVPLLVEGSDGRLREPFETLGRVAIATPIARRRRRTALLSRRSSLPLRRRRGALSCEPKLHREREIIART